MTNDKYKMVQDLADGWRAKYEDAKQQLVKAQRAIDEHTYWKAKALDLEVKRDIAVSTLERVKVDRATAQKALAAQCEETKKLRAQINVLREAIKFWMRAEGNYDLMKADKLFQEVLSSTLEQSIAEYRNKVIEECAKRAEAYAYMSQNFNALAEELRAMKEQP